MRYVGNCDSVDWTQLLVQLMHCPPAKRGPGHHQADHPNANGMHKQWNDAGYVLTDAGGTVGWDMYLSGANFPHSIVTQVCDWIGIENISTWISAIHPGEYAPLHYDFQDDETVFDQPGVERYHVHITKSVPGHAFFVGNECAYGYSAGDVYQWGSWRDYHAGVNAGLQKKFTMNIIGKRYD